LGWRRRSVLSGLAVSVIVKSCVIGASPDACAPVVLLGIVMLLLLAVTVLLGVRPCAIVALSDTCVPVVL
jgi:hypothetical protein